MSSSSLDSVWGDTDVIVARLCSGRPGASRPSTTLGTIVSSSPFEAARDDPEPVDGSRGRRAEGARGGTVEGVTSGTGAATDFSAQRTHCSQSVSVAGISRPHDEQCVKRTTPEQARSRVHAGAPYGARPVPAARTGSPAGEEWTDSPTIRDRGRRSADKRPGNRDAWDAENGSPLTTLSRPPSLVAREAGRQAMDQRHEDQRRETPKTEDQRPKTVRYAGSSSRFRVA